MDVKRLKEIEDIYQDLKARFDAGEIGGDDMKSELKKVMLRDEENRFWMIGSKTGGWYVYDGSSWKAGNPYGQAETAPLVQLEPAAPRRQEPPPAREEELKVESEPPLLCKFCQSRIEKHDVYCNFCGGQQKGTTKSSPRKIPEGQLLVKAVSIPSLIFFFGGIGLVAGVVVGATFGILKIFGDLIFQFPMMLQEMQGKIQGGLFFGGLGGIFGFLAFAVLAAACGLLFNLIAYVFGGLRFKIKT
ncbi:MAG: hypothetical protein NTW95_00340 [Candidatus Aminicenantes bacterium]|nr:hypothetical protein [Candidatus Aminicenantes bacterium]